MLALPGALIALGLAYLAALGTVERDRRDLALLRARGARRRDLRGARARPRASSWGSSPASRAPALAFAAVHCSCRAAALATSGRVAVTIASCIALAVAGALAARIGAEHARLPRERERGTPAASGARHAAVAAALPRSARARGQRPDLLAHGPDGLLGGREPGLESDPLAVGLHVLRAGAALDRRDAAPRPASRTRAAPGSPGAGAGGRATTLRGFLLASAGRRGRRDQPRRSSSSGCCSRSV